MTKDNLLSIQSSVTHAGLKSQGLDMALIVLPSSATTSAVFTQNKFIAAPVKVAKQHLEKTQETQNNQALPVRGLLINSGNANCGTGIAGEQLALQSCQQVAQQLGCEEFQILPFSTGVINQSIDPSVFSKGVEQCLTSLDKVNWQDFAEAIMTTDTQRKVAQTELLIDNQKVQIIGVAKGAGMIHPNMATMLSFVFTNANIPYSDLQQALQGAVQQSFNCITVDGDTSTNDSCTLTATSDLPLTINSDTSYWQPWCEGLNQVMIDLAKQIVQDAEGATKLVEIQVVQGYSTEDCREVALTIAHSPLVKTALFAEDPNLGRIAAAVGRSKVDQMEFDKIKIWLDDLLIMQHGQLPTDYDESLAQAVMKKDAFSIRVSLQTGDAKATIWTCDLSQEYVVINSEYRS